MDTKIISETGAKKCLHCCFSSEEKRGDGGSARDEDGTDSGGLEGVIGNSLNCPDKNKSSQPKIK